MKRFGLALLLMQSSLLLASNKPKPNPADFPLTVHVVYSRFVFGDVIGNGHQELETMIQGQQVELRSVDALGVFALGDYKGMAITTATQLGTKSGYIPVHPYPLDNFNIYRLLQPDGTSRDFYLIGLGPKEPYPSQPPPSAPTNP